MFATVLTRASAKNMCCRVLMAMEPSGLSWLALYERRTGCGHAGCLVHCPAVCHHRQTLPEGPRKTATQEAASVLALLPQGQCGLPVVRAPARTAADRLRQRHLARKQRGSPRRKQLRAALPGTMKRWWERAIS
jgi:hypothetical protein